MLTATGQSLPQQWHKYNNGHAMKAGDLPSEGFYSESKMEEIRLYFGQTNYWNLLTQNYNSKTDILSKMTYGGQTYDSIGVRFKGQTSYFMNTSQKKSFNISMDYIKDGQEIDGYKSLNLNNSWTDPSFMREVVYYNLIRNHTPAAKANFVRLFINDIDWGVYQNVEQLNKDFLQEWYTDNDGVNIRADVPDGSSSGPGGGGGGMGGMWGDGTAALNYLGTDTAKYQKYYTLKSSGVSDPWQQLIKACDILQNTPSTNLESIAPQYFDIDKILWHLASEIAFSDDDSYVFKGKMDYYLYQDAATGRWATYDYDANSTMETAHVSWSPFYNETKTNYPLLNKILAVPAFRQRYLAHLRTIISELFDETKVNALIDTYDAQIKVAVFADIKKPTSNNAYTNELKTLKNFIKDRKVFLLNNTEVKTVSPEISDVAYNVDGIQWAKINPQDDVLITAKVHFSGGLHQVNIHFGTGFSGLYQSMAMYDDGTNGDVLASDGLYSAILPTYGAGTLVKYYVEAIGNDVAKTRAYFPKGAEHDVMIYDIEADVASARTVVINEFMASNTGIIKDENDETEDWIEFYNTTSDDINMSGYNLTDNVDNLTKFTFAENTILKANSYLIIWADEDQTQGSNHANFKLSASGESIILLDQNLVILDEVTFGQQTTNKSSARKPNGTGNFVIGDHTFNVNNDGPTQTLDTGYDSFTVHPNPASNYIVVNGPIAPIELYNLQSKLVMIATQPKTNTIDISNLPNGMYIIKCGPATKKLIIMK
ncbi:MAG: CotH kinase family protein [Saprospiraceae bacterium]|nr:CotH kinase family protein [Saprospiraceae bacterium]